MNTILSIDAWRDGAGSWTWNNWFRVGEVEDIPPTTRQILRFMRAEGYLSAKSAGLVMVDDDGYNLVICKRSNGCPLFAICYGENQ